MSNLIFIFYTIIVVYLHEKEERALMNRIFSILILGLTLSPVITSATVGGGQSLEFLGYDVKDQKLYLLRDFQDGRGRLPQLYYYQFNWKTTKPKLIEVKSIYINPKTKQIDYDQDGKQFEKDLNKIKKRLIPLIHQNKNQVKLKITKKVIKQQPDLYEPEKTMSEYHYQYQVISGKYYSSIHSAISYKPDLKINQSFAIPKQPYKIVSTQYLAFPEESGYTTEDPVLLRRY